MTSLTNKCLSWLRTYPDAIGGTCVLFALYAVSLYRYVLFHSLAELFSIVVACGVFMVYWNARRFLDNDYFLFVGIGYLCVGFIDLLHTLAYKGMGVLPADDGNLANQLWIAARYLESLSFVGACVFLHRRLNVRLVAMGYAAAVAAILGSIFLWGIFPDCFIDGVGVTTFKTISEMIICGILAASISLLVRRRAEFDRTVFGFLLSSLLVTIASELSFSYYTNPYGIANLSGHLLKLVSFYLLYRAFIEEGLKRPYDLIFRDLKRANFCVEQAGDCIFWIDSEARIVFANRKASEVLGYSSEELQAMTVFDINPTITRAWWGPHWEAIRQKKTFILESCHRTKSGETFPVEISVNYMMFDGKEYNCAFARDASERKRAEGQLAHFSAIVNSSQDAIVGGSLDGIVASWNPGAERLYGYTAGEMVGHSLLTLMPADRLNEIPILLASLRQGGRIEHFDTVRRRKDGTLVDVSVTLSPIQDTQGRIIGASSIAHEITDRKRAEDGLRESEEKYKRLTEACPDGVVMTDMNGRVVFASQQIAHLLGLEPEKLAGRNVFEWVIEDDRQRLAKNFGEVVKTGIRRDTEYTALRRDGTTVPVAASSAVIRDARGQAIGVVGMIRDITDRKRTERELLDAKQAAEAANRAKTEFLANMSHELRTPMTAILGFTDILMEKPTIEEAAEACRIVKRNAEHLLCLINDILDLSKIEAGKYALDFQACSPRQVVSDVTSSMQVRADAKGLALSVEYRGDLPEQINTDPLRLRQVLVNLVGNAIKFTEVGGVRLSVERCEASDGSGRLRFDIADTGIGMSPEQTAMLFQPFSQVDTSARRRFGGTGLGLAISKRLAGMLGGDITVSSVLGNGSTFGVTIATGVSDIPEPIAPSTDVPPPSLLACRPEKLNGRILLVEDGPDNQRLIAFLLRKAGADVTIAENGQVAVDLALQQEQAGAPFDLILMDMQMPVMDGYEATRRLRQAGGRSPILALTAHAMSDARQECIDAGCDDYLSKPIDATTLLDAIALWIIKSRASAALPGRMAGR